MKKVFGVFFLLLSISTNAQMWGLYTLYSVKGTNTAFLIDTNNNVYKTWTFPTNKKTCFSTYLTPGDTIVRTVTYANNQISGGPISGEVQKVDWNGNVVWDYVYSTAQYVIHHDICPMPNGNVLMIALEVKTASEVTQAGSSVSSIRHADKIIEVHPTGPNTGDIIWEWKIWGHLCQNYAPTKDNYVTSIVQNPQLININYNNSIDLIHMNGIDYNSVLNQITFSAFNFSEIFVIDHSTTTAEAAGHTGGNSGHGGDIIYRWGNPAAYGALGTSFVNVSHDAHWISADNPYYPNYLGVFNNSGGIGGKSAIDVIAPPYNGYTYTHTSGQAYGPTNYAWYYSAPSLSTNEGNSQQLANGNSLMCITFADSIIEVNNSGNIIWNFNPGGKVSKAYRFSKCYVRGPKASAGASATNITIGLPVTLSSSATSVTENNPNYTYSWTSVPAGFTSTVQNPSLNPSSTTKYIVTITNTAIGCADTASITVTVGTNGVEEQNDTTQALVLYPNPTSGQLNITGMLKNNKDVELSVLNIFGQTEMTVHNATNIDFSVLANGTYFLSVKSNNKEIGKYKVVKSN